MNESPPAEAGPRVLLVDDDEPLLSALRRALTRGGYTLHAVVSIDEAFRELRRHEFHAVIVDYQLGRDSGERVLRAAGELRHRPFRILISGAQPPTKELRDGGAFDAFFTKPFAVGALLELLQNPRSRG